MNFVHPEDRDYVDKAVKEALNGKPFDIDYRIISVSGEEHIVHMQFKVIFSEQNVPIRIKGIIQDITEHKHLEEQIRQRVEELELMMDVVPVAIFMGHDSQGQNITGNKKANEYSEAEIGENISASITHTRRFFHKGRELLAEELPVQQAALKDIDVRDVEIDYLLPSGQRKVVLGSASPLHDSEGHVRGSVGAFVDITERIETEEALEKMQGTHIKEIHHRIKNNLQIISSLLSLEAEKYSDTKVLESFKNSQNRVTSMALIHEELYKGKDIDTIDFAAYLRKLTADLLDSYLVGSDNITLILDLEQSHFNMDTAIPLGIIVNELVSNALKHAFPDRRKGEILVALKRTENFTIYEDECREKGNFQHVLTVADNGIGFPDEIDLQAAESLGLQLIYVLIEQIDGCIELKTDHGTNFTIWFNNLEK
ncbi:Sensory transduction histidine kinase [Methanosarcina horonobensis HB-1 = JCM 15518]|uniref:Sensory transduction histidine kinase n=1 Tax=Methanosarcina horonobensis HB-1 = JCM 15518 TaxID=1434110 RepID=A0A0E3SA73_9EURY|nr:sensor histidine kinase [Methanosarcina horonobensis]AKB78569.1 Sensory transduction histidine kinase [Methanosarcina horonobensis HB-1 = JCM 15518]